MSSFRLFYAVDPDAATRARIGDAIARTRSLLPAARWVDAERLHLTIAFLGWTDEGRLDALGPIATAAARASAPFELGIAGAAGFGPAKHPRVLFASVTGDVELLRGLQRTLAEGLEASGFPLEKREYSPHLTLARAGDKAGDAGLLRCAEALSDEDFGRFRVDSLVLYRSQPGGAGSLYTALATTPLGT